MEEKCVDKGTANKNTFIVKLVLILINIFLIFSAIIVSWVYSRNVKEQQQNGQKETFKATIESMKQISTNYLTMELGYAKDWAQYIDEHEMTMEEALAYIRQANNQKERYAHLVDMQTFEAYSAYGKNGYTKVGCYQKFLENDSETNRIFIENMNQMYLMYNDDIHILGKYRADDIQLNVISVGTKVTLWMDDGTSKDYLLLRLIPIGSIRKIWVFPVEYMDAEIGIITRSGAYVVPSKSMKSNSFADFIRGYNFENDYNKIDQLIYRLTNKDRGLLEYKNSKGEMCYWYYSSFGQASGLHILGCIPVSKLNTTETDWTIVIMTCGILLVLVLLDGTYVLYINKKLREAFQIADSASHAKTQFLSTMSHDIRTPMNAIIGMTNIAMSHVDDPERVSQSLDKVSLASQHLLTLINNILDISKIESGNFALNPSVMSLDQSIDKLIGIMHIEIENKNIEFDVERKIDYPYLVADELRLNQIFINILSNAIKYTPQGGQIHLKVWEEAINQDHVKVIYQVADSGIGMTKEFQKHMYQMFARSQDSRVDKTQGTGLGLAIVKQMVELMSGQIQCDSSPGEGTVFTITLELERASQQVRENLKEIKQSSLEEQNYFEGIHILIAEDNDLNWEVIYELLKQYHVECDRAEDGEICVDKLEASADHAYDLVLMDVQMPRMDGKQATRRIRESSRDYVRNITIVAMTADAFAEDIQECRDAGMNAHIAKPVDIQKVLDVLRKIKQENMESSE